MGYTKVYALKGGWREWLKENYPTEKKWPFIPQKAMGSGLTLSGVSQSNEQPPGVIKTDAEEFKIGGLGLTLQKPFQGCHWGVEATLNQER
jgi:hypothetical protein